MLLAAFAVVVLVRASQGATATSGVTSAQPGSPSAISSGIAAISSHDPTREPSPSPEPTQTPQPTPVPSFPHMTPRTALPVRQPGEIFTHGDIRWPYVYITVDDCSDWANVEKDLETVRAKNAHITLFPAGKYIDAHPADAARVLMKAVAYGDEIDNHTYAHVKVLPSVTTGFDADLGAQLHAVRQALKDPTYEEWFVRPPFGALDNPYFITAAAKLGLGVALWSIDSNGYQNGSTLRSVMKSVFDTGHFQNGGIILLHSDDTDTAALPFIIDTIADRGLKVGGVLNKILVDRSGTAAADRNSRTAGASDAELVMGREDYPPVQD